MRDNEFASWQLTDRFTAREVAALQIGLLPREATDEQLEPLRRRIKQDYYDAIKFYSQQINQTEDWYCFSSLPETALRSHAMVQLFDSTDWDPKHIDHRLYDWLTGSSKEMGEWHRSNVSEQYFMWEEIARWIKANNIPSVFPFDREEQPIAIGKSECSSDSRRTPNRTSLMDAVEDASAKFWGANVRADDHSTHPSNPVVAKWLIDNGKADKTMASKIATIIRPSWAHKGSPLKD
jgi:hypothetical protein